MIDVHDALAEIKAQLGPRFTFTDEERIQEILLDLRDNAHEDGYDVGYGDGEGAAQGDYDMGYDEGYQAAVDDYDG